MKIDGVIKKLIKAKEKFGNIECCIGIFDHFDGILSSHTIRHIETGTTISADDNTKFITRVFLNNYKGKL